jgi:copper oxidase (laccase) domain-containing protein
LASANGNVNDDTVIGLEAFRATMHSGQPECDQQCWDRSRSAGPMVKRRRMIDDIGVDTYSDEPFYSYRHPVHRNEPD